MASTSKLKGATLDEWLEWLEETLKMKPLAPYGASENPEGEERYVLEAFKEAVERLKGAEGG